MSQQANNSDNQSTFKSQKLMSKDGGRPENEILCTTTLDNTQQLLANYEIQKKTKLSRHVPSNAEPIENI